MIAINQYQNFVVIADKVVQRDDGSIQEFSVWVFDSPVGQYQNPKPLSVRSNLRLDLLSLKEGQLEEKEIITLGKDLADMLLPKGVVRDLYRRSLAALPEEKGLRLVLHLDGHLASVPWEYLYLSESEGEQDSTGFLSLKTRISIVRHEDMPIQPSQRSPRNSRMLVAFASPKDDEALQVEQEYRKIKDAVKNRRDLKVDIIENTTAKKLAEELTKGAFIFHFGGHGKSNQSIIDRNSGDILLVTEDGKSDPIKRDLLAINLDNGRVQLVVLVACETGRRDEQNGGIVEVLMKRGIPAVVAMQFKILDKSAIEFSSRFYEELGKGRPLDWAVSAGRLAVYNLCNDSSSDKDKEKYWRDWGVPVLYWRGKGNFVLPAMENELDKYRNYNPFGKQGRITDSKDFFGREELLYRLFEYIAKGSNCSLVGESEIGKSSILSMVCHWGPERIGLPPDAFIYMDMKSLHNEEQFFPDLCKKMEIKTCYGYEFEKELKAKENRYILCIDEIEKMKRKEHFTGDERSELRGLAESSDAPLTLIIASLSPLNELFPDSDRMTSQLYDIFRQMNVGPFSHKEACDFLNYGLGGTGVTFTESQINELLTETKCHPARLQQAAANLYNRLMHKENS